MGDHGEIREGMWRMIDIKSLKKEDEARNVTYTDGVGCKEYGHITSWNERNIFVDYGNSCGRGIATRPDDLTFV